MGKRVLHAFYLHEYLCSKSQRMSHALMLPLQSCKILLGSLLMFGRLHLGFTSRDPRGAVNAGMALSAFAKALRATFAVEPRLFEGLGSTRRCFGHLLHQRPALSGFSAGRNSSNTAADLQSNEEHPRPSGETPPPPGSTAEGLGLEREWTPQSRRTGVIAVKLGMTQLWNKEGFPMAVTVLQARMATLEILSKDFALAAL